MSDKKQVKLIMEVNKEDCDVVTTVTSDIVNDALGYTPMDQSLKGANLGVSELDANGKVVSSQLPSYVDDVIEGYLYNGSFYKESSHTTKITVETCKIYIDLSTGKTYRWSGSIYTVISETLALGETSSTAYRGDRGKIAYDHSQTAHAPSNAEKNQNAFANVKVGDTTIIADNTSDTLTLTAGDNITITPDATTDSVTISATDTTYEDVTDTESGLMSPEYKSKLDGIAAGANNYTLPSAGTALGGVKSGGDVTISSGVITVKDDSHNHVISNIDGLQDELNGKSPINHSHLYAGSSEASGAATSANKLNTNAGSATNPVYFSNGVPVKTTYTLGKSVPSNALFTDTHYTTGLKVGASSTATANAAATNGNVYLNALDNTTVRDSHKITGSGATTVTSDANGVITISSTNTTYTSLKNPYALTIQGNGKTLTNGTYDGSAAKTVNITPSSIGAAASSHTHNYAGSSSAGGAATSANKLATARTINGVSFDGSSNIKLYAGMSWTVGTDSASSGGYYKFMSITMIRYGDFNMMLAITNEYSSICNGIFAIHVRCDSSTTTSAPNIFNWLVRRGWAANSIIAVVSGLKVDFYINQTVTQYGGIRFTVISESSRRGAATYTIVSSTAPTTGLTASATSSDSGVVDSANKWDTSRNINGLSIDGTANRVNYGTCSTAAATAAKVVACTGFALVTGAEITVKFTVTNTASSPTLNVNSTGAKSIYYRGSAITAGYLAANRTYTFRYNGTQYDLVGDIDTNSTYTSLKNPYALTIQGNGKTLTNGTYDGSAAKTVNITPSSIGAAASSHTHSYLPLSGGTISSSNYGPLTIERTGSTNAAGIIFKNSNGKLGSIAMASTGADGLIRYDADSTRYDILDTGNAFTTAAPKANGTAAAGSATTVSRSDHVHPLQTSVSGSSGSCTGNAATATKWATARNINGLSVDGTANRANYGTCSTAAATQAKIVNCSGFALITGSEITVKFTVTNTASQPTLNVNGTGNKAIKYRGSNITAGYLAANRTYTFRYDGTNYDLVGDINTDTDTDTKVTQTNTTTSSAYRLLMSYNANDTTQTLGARKSAKFTANPSTGCLTAKMFKGAYTTVYSGTIAASSGTITISNLWNYSILFVSISNIDSSLAQVDRYPIAVQNLYASTSNMEVIHFFENDGSYSTSTSNFLRFKKSSTANSIDITTEGIKKIGMIEIEAFL